MNSGYLTLFILYLLSGILIVSLSQCHTSRSIQTGREAFHAKQYAKAAQLLSQEYTEAKNRNNKAILAFFTAESYTKIKQPEAAEKWYYHAYNKGYGDVALTRYAETLIRQERYSEAQEVFETLQKQSKGQYSFERKLIQTKRAQSILEQYRDSLYEILPLPINTEYNEYGIITSSNNEIIFTSDRPAHAKSKIYDWTGKYYSNIFVERAAKDIDIWLPVLSSEYNDGTPTINKSKDLIVYTSCYGTDQESDATCKLLLSQKIEGVWAEPEVLPFVDERYNYTTPAWNSDGTLLTFSSNLPNGKGQYDLYAVSFEKNTWGEPFNLGNRINSASDELYPVWDNDTLYFSSDGLGGMGGLDIFSCYIKYNNRFSAPKNMGYPFNSGGDEICAVRIPLNDQKLKRSFYISSTRGMGLGGFDIYKIFEYNDKEAENTVSKTTPALYLAISTFTHPRAHTKKRRLLPGVQLISSTGDTLHTDIKGLAIIPIQPNTSLSFVISKPGYFTQSIEFSNENSSLYKGLKEYTYHLNVLLKPIIKDKEIVLKDIHYDFDKWNIRKDARPTLDSLYQLLTLNPQLSIELAAHTDCRGAEDYNLTLSQKRANSVVSYLIKKGIKAERLTPKGYGESRPLIDCVCPDCSTEQRQKNRRTTFKVLSK